MKSEDSTSPQCIHDKKYEYNQAQHRFLDQDKLYIAYLLKFEENFSLKLLPSLIGPLPYDQNTLDMSADPLWMNKVLEG